MRIILCMGSVMLLPLNWMYLWCEVSSHLGRAPLQSLQVYVLHVDTVIMTGSPSLYVCTADGKHWPWSVPWGGRGCQDTLPSSSPHAGSHQPCRCRRSPHVHGHLHFFRGQLGKKKNSSCNMHVPMWVNSQTRGVNYCIVYITVSLMAGKELGIKSQTHVHINNAIQRPHQRT